MIADRITCLLFTLCIFLSIDGTGSGEHPSFKGSPSTCTMSSTDDTCVPIVVSKKYNLIEYRYMYMYFILDLRVQYHVRVLVDRIEPSPIKGMNRRLLTVSQGFLCDMHGGGSAGYGCRCWLVTYGCLL